MSLTLLIWLLLFAGLTLATLTRPVYAVALYMLTFFLSPPFWWWGDLIEPYRWNLISGFILLGAALVSPAPQPTQRVRTVLIVSLAMILNAVFVNFAIAGNSYHSADSFTEFIKFFLLMYMIIRTVRSIDDLQIVMLAILLGAAYIGYEATVNERGKIVQNRLEGVGAPGATTANHFASLMVTVLPLVAPFFLVGRLWQKVLVVCLAPLLVNTILLCNSRGAFLAAIFSAGVFIATAPKEVRSKAWKVVGIGALGVFFMLGDARIIDRFMTTFSSSEERDRSAQSRLDFASAGLAMIADYPLGAGGHGFKKVHGVKYLRAAGASNVARAVHNGYLNEACEWGLQGLLMRLYWFYVTIRIGFAFTRRGQEDLGMDPFLLLTMCALLSGLGAYLVTYLFGDQNSSEWGYWMVALVVAVELIGQALREQAWFEWGQQEEDDEVAASDSEDTAALAS